MSHYVAVWVPEKWICDSCGQEETAEQVVDACWATIPSTGQHYCSACWK